MRKIIITVASLLALAVPAAGMATVAVDATGVGSIGKGDVQTALGYGNGNDTAFQADAQAGKITFSVAPNVTKIIYDIKCSASDNWQPGDPFTEQHNVIATLTQERTANVKATTNNAGKVTGYTANGITPGKSTVTLGSAYDKCPTGEKMLGFIDPLAAAHTEDVPGGSTLTVSGNGKTVALPNTPVPTV